MPLRAMQIVARWSCGLTPEISRRLPRPSDSRRAASVSRCSPPVSTTMPSALRDCRLACDAATTAIGEHNEAGEERQAQRKPSGYGETPACSCHDTSPNGSPRRGQVPSSQESQPIWTAVVTCAAATP